MKWVNHEILTGVIVYAATEDFLAAAFSMAGAIFPDKVEGSPRDFATWRSRHRGWSHWPLLYVALIALLSGASGVTLPPWMAEAERGGIFFAVGALLHIAEDALCGKVPLLRPDQKVGVRFFKVGSVTEYLFTIAAVAVVYFVSVNLR